MPCPVTTARCVAPKGTPGYLARIVTAALTAAVLAAAAGAPWAVYADTDFLQRPIDTE